MSPQQVRGIPIDGRTDLFSLGCVLYSLTVGEAPFVGDSAFDQMEAVVRHHPEPPHVRNPRVPEALSALIMRLLAKEPDDRPASADELIGALEQLSPDPVPDPLPTPTVSVTDDRPRSRGVGNYRRVPWLLLIIAPVLLLLAGLWVGQVFDRTGVVGDQAGSFDGVREELLSGYLDVLIDNDRDPERQGVFLDGFATLPLRPGDEYCIEAGLTPPAYAYLVLVDTEGRAHPVYPWLQPGDWDSGRPAVEHPVSKLRRPEAMDRFYKVPPAASGMLTIALLVRGTPLPADTDLRRQFTGLPRSRGLARPNEFAWFENGGRARSRRGSPGVLEESSRDRPVLAVQERLRRMKAEGLFEYILAVSFTNMGP